MCVYAVTELKQPVCCIFVVCLANTRKSFNSINCTWHESISHTFIWRNISTPVYKCWSLVIFSYSLSNLLLFCFFMVLCVDKYTLQDASFNSKLLQTRLVRGSSVLSTNAIRLMWRFFFWYVDEKYAWPQKNDQIKKKENKNKAMK